MGVRGEIAAHCSYLNLSSILDSSPRQEFPARSGSLCQRRSRESNEASGPRLAKREARSSLINRKARWTLRFVNSYSVGRRFGVDGSQEIAEEIGNHPVFCLFLSLSSPLIFRAGADPQKLPHSRNTRFPSGIGGRKLLITYRVPEKKKDRDYIKTRACREGGALRVDPKYYTFSLVAETTRWPAVVDV